MCATATGRRSAIARWTPGPWTAGVVRRTDEPEGEARRGRRCIRLSARARGPRSPVGILRYIVSYKLKYTHYALRTTVRREFMTDAVEMRLNTLITIDVGCQ